MLGRNLSKNLWISYESEYLRKLTKIYKNFWIVPINLLSIYRLEVSFIMRTSMIKGFSTALSVFTERFILFAAIVAFVVMGGEIRPQITFSLVQYFNLLQLACNIFFPLALSFLAETKVSVKRIEVCIYKYSFFSSVEL